MSLNELIKFSNDHCVNFDDPLYVNIGENIEPVYIHQTYLTALPTGFGVGCHIIVDVSEDVRDFFVRRGE